MVILSYLIMSYLIYHVLMLWYWWYLHTWLISIRCWSWPKIKVTRSKIKVKYAFYFGLTISQRLPLFPCQRTGQQLKIQIITTREVIASISLKKKETWGVPCCLSLIAPFMALGENKHLILMIHIMIGHKWTSRSNIYVKIKHSR